MDLQTNTTRLHFVALKKRGFTYCPIPAQICHHKENNISEEHPVIYLWILEGKKKMRLCTINQHFHTLTMLLSLKYFSTRPFSTL